ncbi:hypothetical protein Cs7R123_32860 [Catellatospora sp. TT07R-123]|uniref:hypothetical protein n=1 Tax=Catellatospora sp. TT07R-123 TaxID=2733863 RepID=UPI001B243731|nr:hypothetical protein [Catellatospora sp. TT07R-123]GHJ45944.1 hypothetical protein Cs7R123_32860 [Catellatospora sp. TT07R-123]
MSSPTGVAPANAVSDEHSKDILYREVYDPFTATWFRELAASPERKDLLGRVGPGDALTGLNRMNEMFRDLVDASLRELGPRLDGMLGLVATHCDEVTWAGQRVPPPGASPEQLLASLTHKLKRNISLGAVEAVICLESALRYGRDVVGLSGDPLRELLRGSRQLYKALAYVHDDQEKTRFEFLTGTTGFLAYPDATFEHVLLHGRYRIPADKFVLIGAGGERRLRFVPLPPHTEPLATPVKRCPAERLRGIVDEHPTLNAALWDLVIDIYDRSGRFAPA